jgi:ankyrin repeat protein
MRAIFGSRLAAVVVLLSWLAGVAHASSGLQLVEAMQARDAIAVRALLEQGAPVNVAQADGVTALHWAAHWNDPHVAALLIRAGANVNAVDEHGVTPLSLACVNASAAMVDGLLKAGADPGLALASGETVLMTAARTGNAAVVKLLLARGADVQAKERESGQTALMWAVAENHLEVVRLLLQQGADVHARSDGGFTPLLFAAQQGSVAIATVLLAAGADANETALDGSSALLVAADSAHKFVVSDGGRHAAVAMLLLQKGADPNADEAGRTALHSAVQAAEPGLVEALLAAGANPNARLAKPLPQLGRQLGNAFRVNTVGATPFWLAAKLADVRIMQLLAAGGADARLGTKDASTPLMAAAGIAYQEDQDRYGRRHFGDLAPGRAAALDAVRLAVELGGDVNIANTSGVTALHAAVLVGGMELPRFLVEQGAAIDVTDKQGRTPISLADGVYSGASFKAQPEVAELLRGLRADTAATDRTAR